MRVGFNGFGQPYVFRAGLGELCPDADGNYSECPPTTTDTGTPVTIQFPGSNVPVTEGPATTPIATTTFDTPADNNYITGCSAYDADGNCVTCGAGYKFNSYGGAYTGCDSIGGTPGAKKPVIQPNAFSQILNSIFGASRPLNVSNASACATAGGVWNGTTCTPKGTVNLGGVALSTSTLLIGGVVLLFLMKKK